MPNVQFQSITDSLLRLPQVIQSIPDLLRDPSANPLQAAILLGMVIVLLLIVLLIVVLVIMGRSYEADLVAEQASVAEESGGVATAPVPRAPFAWVTTVSIVILLLAVVWVVTGVTTSSSQVCASCHTDTPHTAARGDDPHANVSCVSCHESGGPVARATVDLATRIQHVIQARANADQTIGYGKPVSSDACMECHRDQISSTVFIKSQGVSVSHKEPIASGAQCVDCHALNAGVVNATTVGMSPCLRCHEGKTAKAACTTCHTGDPSTAIRASVAPSAMAAVQVPNPQCNGCHTDMTKCNACHGIAMPHSQQFMVYGHARDAAIQIWNTGTDTVCSKCHYPGHNDCQQAGCHAAPFPSHPSPVWRTMHALSPWSAPATACSCHKWNPYDHNGMTFCEICHATKPANAVP